MRKTNQSSKRNNGSASKLIGSCYLLNIYLKDKISSWSFKEKARVTENLALAVNFLENNAKKYNIDLRIKGNLSHENDIQYPGVIPVNMFENPQWTEDIFELMDYCNGNDAVEHIKKEFKVNQVVIIFHINKKGTSYNLTYSEGINPIYYAERVVMFYKYENAVPTYAASYAHEILHSFGAGELHFPYDSSEERMKIAQEYFSNDVMFRVDYEINNLTIGEYTAYRIGWLQVLNQNYHVFEDEG
ncbi:MAG: hypothetical protein H8D26_01600 [Methanomicrobia archaeon]|nr:hypothetical protein [Methanomicrobia archaeon]